MFGDIFEMLSSEVGWIDPISKAALIGRLWEMRKKYDFHPCQMECNEALETLGLAKKQEGFDDYIWVYKGQEGFDD